MHILRQRQCRRRDAGKAVERNYCANRIDGGKIDAAGADRDHVLRLLHVDGLDRKQACDVGLGQRIRKRKLRLDDELKTGVLRRQRQHQRSAGRELCRARRDAQRAVHDERVARQLQIERRHIRQHKLTRTLVDTYREFVGAARRAREVEHERARHRLHVGVVELQVERTDEAGAVVLVRAQLSDEHVGVRHGRRLRVGVDDGGGQFEGVRIQRAGGKLRLRDEARLQHRQRPALQRTRQANVVLIAGQLRALRHVVRELQQLDRADIGREGEVEFEFGPARAGRRAVDHGEALRRAAAAAARNRIAVRDHDDAAAQYAVIGAADARVLEVDRAELFQLDEFRTAATEITQVVGVADRPRLPAAGRHRVFELVAVLLVFQRQRQRGGPSLIRLQQRRRRRRWRHAHETARIAHGHARIAVVHVYPAHHRRDRRARCSGDRRQHRARGQRESRQGQ